MGTGESTGRTGVVVVSGDRQAGRRLAAALRERTVDRVEVVSAGGAGLAGVEDTSWVDCLVVTDQVAPAATDSVLEAFRPHLGSVPFVLVAENGSEELAASAVNAGADGYVAAPGGIDQSVGQEVRDRVDALLGAEPAGDDAPSGDGTDSRELERATEGLEDLADLVCVLGATGDIQWWNQRFQEATGYDEAALAGLSVVDLVADEDTDQFRTWLGAVGDRDAGTLRVGLDTESGERMACEFSGSAVTEDGSGAVIVVGRDVEDRLIHERELQETTQLYQTVVEQSTDGILIAKDETHLFVNEQLAAMTGYSENELIGEPLFKLIAPEYRDLVRRRHEQRLRGENPPNRYDLELRTKAGERLNVELTVNRIQYEGAPATLATFHDITERKERARELARFKSAAEAAGHAIFLTDTDGIITYANPAFEEITGYAPEEATGLTPRILKSGEMSEQYYGDLWETILAGNVWESTLVNETKTGEYYHAHQTIAPITDEDGDVEEFVSIQTDITRRVERSNQANTLDRVLRHNLRNELNVILAHAEHIEGATGPDLEESVSGIFERIENLLVTADKGRKVSKFLAAETEVKPVDIAGVARQVATAKREDHPEATIQVVGPESVPVRAVGEIERALTELIENSIEHCDCGDPRVELAIEADERSPRIHVRDNGPGLPAAEKLPLVAPEEIDEISHGGGLGLWLVHWIVRRSGGQFDVGETGDGGAEITIRFSRPSTTREEPDEAESVP